MSLAVKGCPSCHVMPGRMLKVHVSPSCDWVQLSATPGAACSVDLSKFSRRSKFSANTSYSGVSIAFHGFTVRMLLTVPSMKVPPDPPADAGAEADAEALALCAHAVPAASSTTIRPLSRTRSPLRTFLMWSLLPWELRVGSYVPLRPRRHAGLVDGERLRVGVQGRLHAKRYRRQVLPMPEGQLVENGDLERPQAALQDVLDRAGTRGVGAGSPPVALEQFADHHAADLVELARVRELMELHLHDVRKLVHLFEEQDRAVEDGIPGRTDQVDEREQVAADDGRGDAAACDRADVRIVGVAGDVARAARGEGCDRRVPGERRALRYPHRAEARAVEGGETGLLAKGDVQVRDVGEAHQRLGIVRDQIVVEEGKDLDRARTAPENLDHVDLRVGEQRVQVFGSLLRGTGDVVVLQPHRVGELDRVALVPPPPERAVDVAGVEVRPGRGHHADRAALVERTAEAGGGDGGHTRSSARCGVLGLPEAGRPNRVRNEALTSVDLVLSCGWSPRSVRRGARMAGIMTESALER